VPIKNAQKTLMLRPITKNIVQMNAAVLQQTDVLWKSIMRKRLFETGLKEYARNVTLD
jgi:hypothetical protein